MAGPAVEVTKSALFNYGPNLLKQTYFDKSAKPKGKHLGRLQAAAGPHKSGDDPHIAGLALDIILFATDPAEKALAERIVKVFLELRPSMAWVSVIYNGETWWRNGTKHKYTGSNDHSTHIHIQWSADSVNKSSWSAEFETALKKEFDATSGAVEPSP